MARGHWGVSVAGGRSRGRSTKRSRSVAVAWQPQPLPIKCLKIKPRGSVAASVAERSRGAYQRCYASVAASQQLIENIERSRGRSTGVAPVAQQRSSKGGYFKYPPATLRYGATGEKGKPGGSPLVGENPRWGRVEGG